MTITTTLALIFTVLASVCIVAAIIFLGWFLIWKAFLSKFRLVRELLGQDEAGQPQQQQQPQQQLHQQVAENNQAERQPHARVKKPRKED